jgi:type II secretory pathway component PulF
MLTFAYTALDAAGAKKTGSVDAETRELAISKLAAEGRFVLDIRQQAAQSQEKKNSEASFGMRRAPSREDIALFTRRMSDLATAGLPLDRVLQVIAEQSESAVLTQVAEEALNEVRTGVPVSQALAKYPKYFTPVYTLTLRSGEASGQFGEVASRLADTLETEATRRSQITSALIYPGVLASMACFVIIFLVTFVLPRLAGVFKDMGGDLPITTQMLLAGAAFITNYWVAILLSIAGVVFGYRLWVSSPSGALYRDGLLLRLPAVGPVIRKAIVSRFARVLGTLVYGGVPILEALEIAGLSAGNRVFIKSAVDVQSDVKAGRSIAEAMRDTSAFPPVLTHMVTVGEETGDLPKMLNRVSDSLDFEVDTGMRRLISLVEPMIVLTLGTFVGFVVVSVLLPIYQAQNLVK